MTYLLILSSLIGWSLYCRERSRRISAERKAVKVQHQVRTVVQQTGEAWRELKPRLHFVASDSGKPVATFAKSGEVEA